MVKNSLAIARRSQQEFAGGGRGLLETRKSIAKIAALNPDLTHEAQRPRASRQGLRIEVMRVLRTVIFQGLTSDAVHRVQVPAGLEFLSQIGQHELDQAFGMPALFLSFVPGNQRGCRQYGHDRHPRQ